MQGALPERQPVSGIEFAAKGAPSFDAELCLGGANESSRFRDETDRRKRQAAFLCHTLVSHLLRACSKALIYQKNGGEGGTRTPDPVIMSHVL